MKPQNILIASCSLLVLLLSNCATDQAAQLRQERPVTVGFLGVGYRPNESNGLGFALGGDASWGAAPLTEIRDRDVKSRGVEIDLAYYHFPYETSAFFFGAGYGRQSGKVTFDADTITGGETEVEYSHMQSYLGVPLGWYWIWENGFTLCLDFGPRFRVAHEKSIDHDGGALVDKDQRDRFIDRIEDANRVKFGGTGIIGYSF